MDSQDQKCSLPIDGRTSHAHAHFSTNVGNNAVTEEIMNLTELYPDTSVSEFDNNISITAVLTTRDLNITMTFVLGPDYPLTAPDLSVQSDHLSASKRVDLQRWLELESYKLIGEPMLTTLMSEVEQFTQQLQQDATSSQKIPDLRQKKDKGDRAAQTVSAERQKTADVKMNCRKSKKSRRRRRDRDTSSSEDEIQTHLECTGNTGTGLLTLTPCEGTGLQTMTGHEDPSGHSGGVPKECDVITQQPTHFIAIRIIDESILAKIREVQRCLVDREPLLEKGVFPSSILHVTVCSLGLDTAEHTTNCIQAIESMKNDLIKSIPKSPLVVHSMSQFYNRAIFAKIQLNKEFLHFCDLLKQRLRQAGVQIRGEYDDFNPHVTIIKVKRPERRLFGSRNIRPAIYSDILDVTFGQQTFDTLHLCSMGGQRREDGFYQTLHELHCL